MSYQELPYTHGSKTLTQINALTGMATGDTVYNTTWELMEVYDGNIWVNDTGIAIQSDGSDVIGPGNAVSLDGTSGGVKLATSSDTTIYMGVVVRGNSNSAGTWLFMAFMGKYQIKLDSSGSINSGDHILLGSSGILDTTTGTINAYSCGKTLEDVGGSGVRDVWVMLQTVEEN